MFLTAAAVRSMPGTRSSTAATPLTLAVIDSKIRCRSREKMSNAAMIAVPKAAPATTEAAATVGVPRPRRLTMPVSPPM